MPDNGAVKEAAKQHQPLDVMVATFADREAARNAYQALRSMDKEGTISMDGAVVIDRNEMGNVRLSGFKVPWWVWAVGIAGSLLLFGALGLFVVAVVGMVRRHAGGSSDYDTGEEIDTGAGMGDYARTERYESGVYSTP